MVRSEGQESPERLTRGEKISVVLRLVILVVLVITLGRALLAFLDLCEKQGIPLGQVVYVPAVFAAAAIVAARAVWRAARKLLDARESKGSGGTPNNGPEVLPPHK